MKAQRVRLEVFAMADGPTDDGELLMRPDSLEEFRLEAFEKGYRAGWEDAEKAAVDSHTRLQAEAARNLQAISFGYHEARAHLLRGLGPLLEHVCARVLPEVARAAVGGIVCEALMPLAEAALDRPVSLVLHPATRPAVEAALAEAVAPPVEIVEDPGLGEGQVFLRSDEAERRIDIDGAVEAIRTAVTEHFQPSQEIRRHG